MTKREIAALICKALAIQTLIGAINLAAPFYLNLTAAISRGGALFFIGDPSPTPAMIALQGVPVIFSIIVGLYLWFRAEDVAAMMIKESATDTELEPIVVGPEASTLVFAGLGVYTLLHTIPQIARIVAAFIYLTLKDPYIQSEITMGTMPNNVALLVELGLGLWLFFGASGLARMVGTIRRMKSEG